jgi:hypothetical protein
MILEYRAKKAGLNKDIQRRRELYVSTVISGETRSLMVDNQHEHQDLITCDSLQDAS